MTLDRDAVDRGLDVFWGAHALRIESAIDVNLDTDERGPVFDAVFVPTRGRALLLRRLLETQALAWEEVYLMPSQTSDLEAVKDLLSRKTVHVIDVSPEEARAAFQISDRVSLMPLRPDPWDVWLKRSMALQIARRAGWKHVMFLDDDIDGISRGVLNNLRRAIEEEPIAGCRFVGVPDHSFVGHILRQVTGEARDYIGSGALAVDIEDTRGQFLNIYNDDWLFILHNVRHEVVAVESVTHAPGSANFGTRNAIGEEVGDVLAEGIRYLKYNAVVGARRDIEVWRDILRVRVCLLMWLREKVMERGATVQSVQVVGALDVLLERHKELNAEGFVKLSEMVGSHYGELL